MCPSVSFYGIMLLIKHMNQSALWSGDSQKFPIYALRSRSRWGAAVVLSSKKTGATLIWWGSHWCVMPKRVKITQNLTGRQDLLLEGTSATACCGPAWLVQPFPLLWRSWCVAAIIHTHHQIPHMLWWLKNEQFILPSANFQISSSEVRLYNHCGQLWVDNHTHHQ